MQISLRPFARPLVLLLGLALAALGNTVLHRVETPLAHATGDQPTILLGSISTDSQFELHLDQPPTGVHLGYGYVQPKSFTDTYSHVIFDEHDIAPSTEQQEFLVYTDQDADAAALSSDLNRPLPEYTFLGMIYWYGQPPGGVHATSAFSNGDVLFHIPLGAHVDHFKMTVPPFSIEKKPQPPGFGSQYGLVNDGSRVVIGAYGPPPPGDATCDAATNSIDALLVLQRSARLMDALPCEKAADVNGDSTIDSIDASLILQFVAGLISQP